MFRCASSAAIRGPLADRQITDGTPDGWVEFARRVGQYRQEVRLVVQVCPEQQIGSQGMRLLAVLTVGIVSDHHEHLKDSFLHPDVIAGLDDVIGIGLLPLRALA